SNRIGGFDSENIAQAFDLDRVRYVTVMIVAIGKEAVEGRTSYRLPINKIVQYH
ncbi:nitroreductase family protein, partial [Staphylococcus felis]|nr:nitroreductase family protein [Staphylococcus felis]